MLVACCKLVQAVGCYSAVMCLGEHMIASGGHKHQVRNVHRHAWHICACNATPCFQVIDLISLKPFDMETISKSVRKTRRVLIVEECMKTGGIGASLSAVISESLFNELDHEVVRLSSQVSSGG